MSPAGIVDAHVHLVRFAGEESTRLLVESARRAGIGRLLCSSLGVERYENPITARGMIAANDYALREMERFPAEIACLCYACPAFPEESLRELERCVARGPMIGVKLWIDARASDPRAIEIAREATRLNVPILQHAFHKTTGNYAQESTPADVAAMAEAVPGARIHMAHLWGGLWRGIAEVAPFSNVWVDTSGSDPERGLLEYGLRELGYDRLLFGSDAPGRGFAAQLGKVTGVEMDESWREAILGGNAARLYGLEAP